MEPMESVEDKSCFNSPTDVISYLGSQLSCSPPPADYRYRLWVFWSQQDDDELRDLFSFFYPDGVDTSNISTLRRIAEDIKAVLQLFNTDFYCNDMLIQLWAPIQNSSGEIYLTTTTQPFGFDKLDKGLCSYRKQCVQLPPIHVNQLDLEHNNNNNNVIGPVGRVFRHGLIEYCSDVSEYLSEEYPLRNCAMNAGVKSYAVVPLFETPDPKHCIGVLEFLSKRPNTGCVTYSILRQLKIWIMLNGGEKRDIHLCCNYDFKVPKGRAKATQILKRLHDAGKIKVAGIWVASCSTTTRCMTRIFSISRNYVHDLDNLCLTKKGEGVVGRAFELHSACFCSNVCKLISNVHSQVLNAREIGLTGCFAICLKSTEDNDLFFILEFFMPPNKVYLRNFIKRIVIVLQKEIGTTPHLVMPANKLWVEVIKISPDEDLDSFEICTNEHFGKVVQHNYQPIGPSSRQPVLELDDVNNEIDVAIEGFDASSNALYQQKITILPTHQNETIQEVGLGMQLSLDPPDDKRSYSVVQSNSLSPIQEVSLGLHLGPSTRNVVWNYTTMIQPNPPSPAPNNSLDIHLGLSRRQQPDGDSTSFSSVRNYSRIKRRSMSPSVSQSVADRDSDFTAINAFTRIMRRENFRLYENDS